jgi:hypothetical protein
MKHLISIASLFIFNLFILCDLYAEAIAPKDVGYFQISGHTSLVVQAPSKAKPMVPTAAGSSTKPIQPPAALLVRMPPKLAQSAVVPTSAPLLTKAGKNPPAGTIPISIDPTSGKVVLLLGYEQGNFDGFTDFGGSGDPTDKSREHTAVREFNEETCLAFWEDLTAQPLNRATMTGAQLEALAKEDVSGNLFPWFYASINKYYTCLLRVRYQSMEDLAKKLQIVRKKVSAAPFHEKSDLAWVPLEDFIGWIKTNTPKPKIPNGKGKDISWRFFGLSLNDFTQNTPPWARDRTIKYLEDIIALNP